jgi:hypothetical protein
LTSMPPGLSDDPACWAWPVADADVAAASACDEVAARDLLQRWQRNRCAVCGDPPNVGGTRLVLDHDHQTGLVRGYLCQSCNIREGQYRGDYGVFIDYRSRPPATLLGITVRYLDPFTGDFAEPAPAPAYDKRRDNPMRGVGL